MVKSNRHRAFIGRSRNDTRASLRRVHRRSYEIGRSSQTNGKGQDEGEEGEGVNINLPITGIREPPIPSSTTGTRFPVFGYCAIVVENSTPRPGANPGLTLLSITDLEIGTTAGLKAAGRLPLTAGHHAGFGCHVRFGNVSFREPTGEPTGEP